MSSPAASAHGFCSTVVITSGGTTAVTIRSAPQTTGTFVPTILDVWAFSGPVQVVPQGIVCPSVIVVAPVVLTPVVITAPPMFIDPPPEGSPSGSPPPSPAPVRPAVTGASLQPSTVGDLAGAPGRFDRQVVTVTGTIGAALDSANDRDVLYTLFRLEAGGASVPVVVWGHPRLTRGQHVRVIGAFHDVAPFVLAGGERPHAVLEAHLITQIGADVSSP
jgi:hypothetical protein